MAMCIDRARSDITTNETTNAGGGEQDLRNERIGSWMRRRIVVW